jgi:hypothetical protein
LIVAEEVEVFSAVQAAGWDCGASNGEGLSRVLATLLYRAEIVGFASAASWLDTSDRPDFVTTNDPTDRNYVSIGCAVSFLNWLNTALGYTWAKVVQSGGPTLGKTYTTLTGRTDAYAAFRKAVDAKYPVGRASGVTTDNPFAASATPGVLADATGATTSASEPATTPPRGSS